MILQQDPFAADGQMDTHDLEFDLATSFVCFLINEAKQRRCGGAIWLRHLRTAIAMLRSRERP